MPTQTVSDEFTEYYRPRTGEHLVGGPFQHEEIIAISIELDERAMWWQLGRRDEIVDGRDLKRNPFALIFRALSENIGGANFRPLNSNIVHLWDVDVLLLLSEPDAQEILCDR